MDTLEFDVKKCSINKKRISGIRVRKAMKEIKTLADQVRKDILEERKIPSSNTIDNYDGNPYL